MALKNYKIEHKILTLAHCAVMNKVAKPASFEIEGIEFTHWDFDYRNGWVTDAWIAYAEVQAEDILGALNLFTKKLSKITPKISLVSQSYTEYVLEPFIIHETRKDIAFLKYIKDVDSVGLMFMEKDLEALKFLVDRNDIPDEFYNYWNDATNSTGYSSKLLLIFSAIEALVKKGGKKDLSLLNKILGEELSTELFQQTTGLRHRLIHGEYFANLDNGKNYVEIIHNKIINYFNTQILPKPLIQEGIVHPQRHFFGNKEMGNFYIKSINTEMDFSLKKVLKDFEENDLNNIKNYKIVFGEETKNY